MKAKIIMVVLALSLTLSLLAVTVPVGACQPKVALYQSESEGTAILYNLLSENYDVTYIGSEEVKAGELSQYDLVVMPGGGTHLLDAILSWKWRQEVKAYVSGGGAFLGICGGASVGGLLHLGGASTNWSIPLMGYFIYYSLTGAKGSAEVDWQEPNLFGMNEGDKTNIVWAAGPYFTDVGQLRVEALYAQNKLLIPMKGEPAIVSGYHGSGKVVLIGPHPEYPYPYPDGGGDNAWIIDTAVEWLIN